MKILILLILFILTSCSSNIKRNDYNVSDELSFQEFKIKLEEYAINNPYPNIDN